MTMKTSKTFIALMVALLCYIGADFAALRLNLLSKDQATFGLHFLWLLIAVIVLWCFAYLKVLPLVLAGAIAYNASAQTNAPFKLLSTQDIKPQFTACEFAIGGVVIVVGGVFIYKICTAPFWTNINPRPGTNPPAPPTNNAARYASGADSALCPIFEFDYLPSTPLALASIPLTNCFVPDLWGKGCFDTYQWGRYPWQSSLDLLTWNDCELRVWSSSNGCLSVVLDGDGIGLATNYTARDADWKAHYYVPPISNVFTRSEVKFFRARYE